MIPDAVTVSRVSEGTQGKALLLIFSLGLFNKVAVSHMQLFALLPDKSLKRHSSSILKLLSCDHAQITFKKKKKKG